MKRLPLALLLAGVLPALAQSIPAPGESSPPVAKPAPAPDTNSAPAAAVAPAKPASARANRTANSELQATVDRLTHTNQELLDLLKEQQSVLKDIQVDRRLLNRQVGLLEQRLEDTLQANATLQAQVSRLQAEAAAAPRDKPAGTTDTVPAKPEAPPLKSEASAKTNVTASAVTPATPPPPLSYLPAESTGGAPGTMWWHRLMMISGDDSEDSKTFHITGKTWRVLWHNQDKPGAAYKNTSALFISAFPANDSIPRKVCSKLGSGGDSSEMTGTGDFYLRIEASGGHWELAVEDFR